MIEKIPRAGTVDMDTMFMSIRLATAAGLVLDAGPDHHVRRSRAYSLGQPRPETYEDPHNGRMMPPALQCSFNALTPVRRHSWAEP